MTTWFTSDTHFGHSNIIKYCNRPYVSADEMDAKLIANWNSCVKDNDVVWFLGDFGMKSTGYLYKVFEQLKGRKHLVAGNHDPNRVKNFGWESVHDYWEISGSGVLLVLCHYPLESWRPAPKGSIMLHGHSHGGSLPKSNRFDVGVDCWNYKPVALEELLALAGRH